MDVLQKLGMLKSWFSSSMMLFMPKGDESILENFGDTKPPLQISYEERAISPQAKMTLGNLPLIVTPHSQSHTRTISHHHGKQQK